MKRIATLLVFSGTLFFFSCTKTSSGEKDASGSSGLSFSGPGASGSGGGGGGGTSNPGNGSAGVITAGEWNDLDNWDFWNTLLRRDTIKDFPAQWGFYTTHRIGIVLRDAQGYLVHDARLLLSGPDTCSAVTDNYGEAELFPGLFNSSYTPLSYTLKAEYLGQSYDLGSIPSGVTSISKTLPVSKTVSNNVDISFVVDATGSMGDEISYLKTEIGDVISRAGAQLPAGTQIHMSSVFYRDHGDDYIVRTYPFTTNTGLITNFIRGQEANGGGDFPEAVDEGLDEAVNHLSWSSNAINRIIFLVLDAPAHQTDEVRTRLRRVIASAQQKGIHIIPVSASGIDRETEFFLRFLAVSTNGTYVFITNDSGIGNPHLQPTVGNYTVEYLNNLLVRLITKYGQNR